MPLMKKLHNTGLIVISSAFLLSAAACTTTNSDSVKSETVSSETVSEASMHKAPMSMADKEAMMTKCKTMHETMMSGDHAGKHKMMSPETKAKHHHCMEMMPEMKAKMKEKCKAKMAVGIMGHNKMDHSKMDHDAMAEKCAMMKSKSESESEP